MFELLLFLAGILTGSIAAVVGFGIGSFLTPLLALRTNFGVAVAAVGIAHFFGSLLRGWLLRHNVNRQLLLRFGTLSAVGGLLGAVLQNRTSNAYLSLLFGGLMIFAGVSSLLHWTDKVRVRGIFTWVVGGLSGFFGGIVGNQGGLRAAALVSFNLKKAEFVATATAIALAVDLFRVPVYITTRAHELSSLAPEVIAMSAGVVVGTVLGAPLLRRLPEIYFRLLLSIFLIIVGSLVMVKL